ncbi:MAG: MMPL family transporter [Nakamurella sp.]
MRRRGLARGFGASGLSPQQHTVHHSAIFMTSVFASFILTEDPMIKQFGFALAVGILIDAFLVRMTLVPAIMSLLGEHAWWLPKWLDRYLLRISLEDEGPNESQGQGLGLGRELPSAEPPERTPEEAFQ